jgi:hypothetical protein
MRRVLQFRDFSEYQASVWPLIVANAIPLVGVLLFGWDTFSIVALYWSENVIIGAINVLKMIVCNPDPAAVDWPGFTQASDSDPKRHIKKQGNLTRNVQWTNHGSKLYFVPLFILHYGLFCMVHGVFVFAIFSHDDGPLGPFGFDNAVEVFTREHLWWGVAALASSHLWSFFVNFLGNGEYRRTAAPLLMAQPYARVVVLHVAILFGGIVAFALGSSALVLIILVIGKTLLDLSLHLRERESNAPRPSKERPEILADVTQADSDQILSRPASTARSRRRARRSSDG